MEFSVHTAWQDLTRRLAVLAGASGALVSLWNDAPVNIAVMRGAGAYFVLLLVAKIASALMSASNTDSQAKKPLASFPIDEDQA